MKAAIDIEIIGLGIVLEEVGPENIIGKAKFQSGTEQGEGFVAVRIPEIQKVLFGLQTEIAPGLLAVIEGSPVSEFIAGVEGAVHGEEGGIELSPHIGIVFDIELDIVVGLGRERGVPGEAEGKLQVHVVVVDPEPELGGVWRTRK